MGYYTRYDLKVVIPYDSMLYGGEEEIIADLRKNNEEANYALSENGCAAESGKWYEFNEDLKEFSQRYPACLFVLSGNGEETGDQWIAYYRNGKVQMIKAKITFDPFDETKLI